MRRVILPGWYRHFKGNIYHVIAPNARHSETGELMVVYRSYPDGVLYVRPYDMFASKVDREKYPDAMQDWRFEQIPDGGEV